MQELNKVIEFKGYKFNMCVRNPDKHELGIGNREKDSHCTIVTNDLGVSNFYRKSIVMKKDIEYYISKHTEQLQNFVNNLSSTKKEDEDFESKLKTLGFE